MTKKKIYDNYFNKANSLIKSISKLFITMLIMLGMITFISAFKEVAREVRTCLDEKFSLVLYSLSHRINDEMFDEEGSIRSDVKMDIDGFIIGNSGFNAIIKNELGTLNTKYITGTAIKNEELNLSLNKQKDIIEYVKKSERPTKFMDLDFKVKAKNIRIENSLYRLRISDTDIEDYYILTASGQDEYYFKMVKIIFSAILLTLIFTPILINGSKFLLKILSEQIKDLNSLVQNIINGDRNVTVIESLCSSKNEIGILANSIKELVANLEEKSNTDELTGIGNRRKLYESLESNTEVDKINAVSMVFVDIDYFKKFNDGYGHLKGDIALKRVATILKEICLSRDVLVTRYGGEEFVIVCYDYNEERVIDLIKEIQFKIENANIEHIYSPIGEKVTLSIGAATTTNKEVDLNEVLLKADEAVYVSKQSGRNRYTHVMV